MKDLRLLVLDDEEDILELLVFDLEDKVSKLFSTGDPLEGIEIIKNNEIDLIITDLSMPNMTGLDLALKVEELKSNIEVIVLSGYSKNELLPQVKSKNVVGFVEKPIFGSALLDAITSTLKKAA